MHITYTFGAKVDNEKDLAYVKSLVIEKKDRRQ